MRVRIALVHYHEIGLKGRNRGQFERRLEENLRWALRGISGVEVARVASRVLVRMPDTSHFFHRKLIDLRGAIQHEVRRWLPDGSN